MAQDCLICRKHAGESDLPGGTIYEDDLLVVGHFRDEDCAYLGHLLIETRRHVIGFDGLDVNEAATVGVLAARLAQALKVTEGAEHVYAYVIGDAVPHFHLHLLPRYPGAPREYYGLHAGEWPDAPHGGAEEIEVVCERVRAWLADQGA